MPVFTIKHVDVNAQTAKALLHCRIKMTDVGDGFTKYEFQTAYHHTISTVTTNVFPVGFPTFTNTLGGDEVLEWYIMVGAGVTVTPNKMKGTWSHDTWIPPHHEFSEDPTDSWTAQGGAGAGDDDDDDDQGAAKSAYA